MPYKPTINLHMGVTKRDQYGYSTSASCSGDRMRSSSTKPYHIYFAKTQFVFASIGDIWWKCISFGGKSRIHSDIAPPTASGFVQPSGMFISHIRFTTSLPSSSWSIAIYSAVTSCYDKTRTICTDSIPAIPGIHQTQYF